MKKGRWSAGLAISVLAMAAGLYAWSGSEAESNTDVRRTTRVAFGSLSETITATGVIRPVTGAEVNVGSRISGTVVSLPVEVGDQVTTGQLLAELDATALQAQADEARADVNLAMPRVDLAESTLARREKLATKGFYGKVNERSGENGQTHLVRFTSVPSEVDAYFQSHRQHAMKPSEC